MKSMNKRSSPLALLWVLIAMSIACLFPDQVMAQVPQTIGQQVYNWKPVGDARAIMINQISSLNQQMPGFTEGTPLYENALRRVAYFKQIVYEIDRGTTVEQSLESAIPAAATLGFTKEATYTSKVVLRALLEEARTMVTN